MTTVSIGELVVASVAPASSGTLTVKPGALAAADFVAAPVPG